MNADGYLALRADSTGVVSMISPKELNRMISNFKVAHLQIVTVILLVKNLIWRKKIQFLTKPF